MELLVPFPNCCQIVVNLFFWYSIHSINFWTRGCSARTYRPILNIAECKDIHSSLSIPGNGRVLSKARPLPPPNMAFSPRLNFPTLSVPRSYFLGHHAAGLSKMKTMLSTVDLIVECRDYRTPLTSRNPLFESHLGTRPRLIVYTKKDLGSNGMTEDRRVRSTKRLQAGYYS